ncbi:SDR family oxidoreductase [Streptomyces lydicus]|uniref:SDR family oxidoreductase n=1 Tax=Streptomyces lydicus TaxID=47763 RepID=UPI003792D150
MATILVTGGTGTLGRPLIDRLLDDGHDVHSLSRRPHTGTERPRLRSHAVDLQDATGLREALAGVDAVVHCASTPSGGDAEAAGHLIDAARAVGVPHLVYISIVGVDRVPLGYYRTKLAVERLIEDSGIGWTVLRTTQFHDLVLQVVKAGARSPVVPVPTGVRVQPVEVREVADRLAELATGAPAGRVTDLGGPEVLQARELVRATLEAGGRRRLLAPLWLPGAGAAAMRRGGLLTPEHADGRRTYAEFLAERVSGERAGSRRRG